MMYNGMWAALSPATEPNLAPHSFIGEVGGGYLCVRGYVQYPLHSSLLRGSSLLKACPTMPNKKKRSKQQPGNSDFVFKRWFILLWIYTLSLARISRTRAVQESIECHSSPVACTASLMLGTTSPCPHCPRNFKPKRPWVKSFIWSFLHYSVLPFRIPRH